MPGTTILFRYARLRRPRIHDLASRTARNPDLAAVPGMDPNERSAWAAARLAGRSEKVEELPLSADYLAIFKGDPLEGVDMPGSDALTEKQRENLAAAAASAEALEEDKAAVLAHAIALKIVGSAEATRAARMLQLLERLPALADGSAAPERFAPAVLDRFAPAPASAPVPEPDENESEKADAGEPAIDRDQMADDIRLLWQLRHMALAAERAEALRSASKEAAKAPEREPEGGPESAAQNGLPQIAPSVAARSRQALADRIERNRRANAARAERMRDLKSRAADNSLASAARMEIETLALAAPGLDPAEIRAAQNRVSAGLSHMKPSDTLKFCRAIAAILEERDKAAPGRQPAVTKPSIALPACFAENPKMRFGDRVELLGRAELIRVEEHFMHYAEAEISYVENILAGEKRLREVRSTKEFETVEESLESESTVTSEETRSTTGSELTKEISTQLATRFNSDVSASASGSGGGSVGVVSFEGEGSLDAGFGLGVDSAISTSTGSRFSSEIVETAAEEVTRTVQSQRMTRSRTLYETLNRHEIDNTIGDEPKNRRGIYCFLDRHVCVTETPYGVRWFLKATVPLPGRNLMCERLTRIAMAMANAEAPPEFNLSPEDVTPGNYLELAGRYRAQGLAPPPAPLQKLGRTYKTDQTNETDVSAEGLEKVGQTLMPVFKAYKRHLVTDTLTIPEGYQLADVELMVNHGANGVSVPVDLPLKMTSAGLMAMPTIYCYGILMLPAALWQILILASPLMHHNTDSSSVTATVGSEAQESHYYFFEADFLIGELLQLLGTFSALAPGIMDSIEQMASNLPETLNTQAQEMTEAMTGAVDGVVTSIRDVFDEIKTQLENISDPLQVDVPALIQSFIDAIIGFDSAIAGVATTVPATLFGPLNAFIEDVVTLISEAAESAMSDMMAALVDASENNQWLQFGGSAGATGEVPVALNVITVKPGVTVTLSACLVRTERALDAWRLDTFSNLYQAYLQLVAEYESKRFLDGPAMPSKSPGTMREEERRSLREIIIHALNGVHDQPDPPNVYAFDRINLFEHGIDWDNMSFRLYTYGPNLKEIRYDAEGVYRGADAKRRAFLNAHWAQVMLPLPEEPALEKAMLAYFETGATQIGAELRTDELTQLWADVIAERGRLGEKPDPERSTELVLPTDFIVLRTEDTLPENPDITCVP